MDRMSQKEKEKSCRYLHEHQTNWIKKTITNGIVEMEPNPLSRRMGGVRVEITVNTEHRWWSFDISINGSWQINSLERFFFSNLCLIITVLDLNKWAGPRVVQKMCSREEQVFKISRFGEKNRIQKTNRQNCVRNCGPMDLLTDSPQQFS